MPTPSRIDALKDRYKTLCANRERWKPLWTEVARYCSPNKQNFYDQHSKGELLTDDIFDDTAEQASRLASSAILGALWPNGARSFELVPTDDMEENGLVTEEVKQYYQFLTRRVASAMDHPKAGLKRSLAESIHDDVVFGTSGMAKFENDDPAVPVLYRAYNVRNILFDENFRGEVDTVYIEKEMTASQLAEEYGLENLSQKVKEALDPTKSRQDELFKVLHVIQPRREYDRFKYGAKDKPIASIHFEHDSKKILKESGFDEMPIDISRFWKAMDEKFGRSAAMSALPSIFEINVLREAMILATEINLDPPMRVFDDGSLGNESIDMSAGAMNVLSVSGRLADLSREPVAPIHQPREMQSSQLRMTELREIISNAFFVDRLLDLNNETRMTLGEAQIRNKLRGESLNSVYARLLDEKFVPLIEGTVSILFRKQLLGTTADSEEVVRIEALGGKPRIIPEAVLETLVSGDDFYKIKFISPAARIMSTEELEGIIQTTEFVTAVAAFNPEAVLKFDEEKAIERVALLTGAPEETLRSTHAVQQIKQAQQQALEAQQQLEAARSVSESTRNFAQAENTGGAQNAG